MISPFVFRAVAISTLTFAVASASLAASVSVSCRTEGSDKFSGCAVGTMMHRVDEGTTWTFFNTGMPIRNADGTMSCGHYEAVVTKIDGSVKINATAVGSWQGNPAQWMTSPDENKIYTKDDLANGPLVFKFQNACSPSLNMSDTPKDTDNQVELQFTEQPPSDAL